MNWYLQRLRTMNLFEVLFRIIQQIKFQINKKNKGRNFDGLIIQKINSPLLNSSNIAESLVNVINVFEIELEYTKVPNWHLDYSTNKEFPKIYSFDIDIRTDKFGSAKYVWEVNRMLFLPRIAINYKNSRNNDDLDLFISQIKSWKKENPYLIGVNWYSNIEVNIRLINWALSWEILNATQLMKNNSSFKTFVEEEWLPLIYQHCIYSSSFPSLFSSANNHLISEYAGLFIANCIWKFKESEEWLKKAQAGLEREILTQHTIEGVNKEEAAEYIQFITDFFLISYVFSEKSNNLFSENYKNRLIKIFEYILGFLDVNGGFPQYGDEDDGRLTQLSGHLHDNNFDSILVSAAIITKDSKFKLKRLKIDNKNLVLFGEDAKAIFDSIEFSTVNNSIFFSQSGHFVFRKLISEKEIYLHFDVAPLGFLSIAAHGHADALSIILHVDGNKILIDPGTFTYHTHPEWRKYFIGTRAHNTVVINNSNQAVNGGPLLWLKHYNVEVEGFEQNSNFEWVEGSHDGYNKIGYKHKRKVTFEKDIQTFTIQDTLTSKNKSEVSIEIPWHIHPDCEINRNGQVYSIVNKGSREVILTVDRRLNSQLVTGITKPILGWYSPSFYKKQPTNVIIGKIDFKLVGEVVFITTIQIK